MRDLLDAALLRESESLEEIGNVALDEQHGPWTLKVAGALVRSLQRAVFHTSYPSGFTRCSSSGATHPVLPFVVREGHAFHFDSVHQLSSIVRFVVFMFLGPVLCCMRESHAFHFDSVQKLSGIVRFVVFMFLGPALCCKRWSCLSL